MGWPDGAGLGCVGVVGGRVGRVGSDIGMGLVRSTVRHSDSYRGAVPLRQSSLLRELVRLYSSSPVST